MERALRLPVFLTSYIYIYIYLQVIFIILVELFIIFQEILINYLILNFQQFNGLRVRGFLFDPLDISNKKFLKNDLQIIIIIIFSSWPKKKPIFLDKWKLLKKAELSSAWISNCWVSSQEENFVIPLFICHVLHY